MTGLSTQRFPRRLGSFFILLVLLSGCIDHNYDLKKDIDLSVGAGGDFLAVPVGNTEPIRLSKIIKTEEADLLQVDAKGDYRLSKRDLVAVEIPRIAPVTIRVSPNAFTPIDLDFGTVTIPPQGTPGAVMPSAPVDGSSQENIDTEIPSQVKKIDWLQFRQQTYAHLSIRVSGTPGPTRKLRFQNMRLIFPSYVRLEETGTHEIVINDEFAVSQGYTRDFGISGLVFEQNPVQEGAIRLPLPVLLEGNVVITEADPAGGTLGDMTLDPELSIQAMEVGLLQGTIDPDIQQTRERVDLKGMPDFLQGEDIVLDVQPHLSFQIDNTLGMTLNVKLKADPLRGEAVIEDGVNDLIFTVDPARVPGEVTTSRLWLAPTNQAVPDDYRYVEAPRLPLLLKKVPTAIELQVDAAPDPSAAQQIDLSVERYTLNLNYDLDVPLSFGPELKLLYLDTMKGFLKDIGDFVDKVTQLEIVSQAANTIPLQLTCRAIPVDRYLDPLEGVEVSAPETIQPGGPSGEIVTSPFNVTIREKTKGALGALDGLILEVTGAGEQRVAHIPLNESQYLQFTMKLKVPGGLHLDLNDL